jgi:hypothetical protein
MLKSSNFLHYQIGIFPQFKCNSNTYEQIRIPNANTGSRNSKDADPNLVYIFMLQLTSEFH